MKTLESDITDYWALPNFGNDIIWPWVEALPPSDRFWHYFSNKFWHTQVGKRNRELAYFRVYIYFASYDDKYRSIIVCTGEV